MSEPKYKLHQIVKINNELYIIKNLNTTQLRCTDICPFTFRCGCRDWIHPAFNNSCQNLIGDCNYFAKFKGGI